MNDFSDLVYIFTDDEIIEHDSEVRKEAIADCLEILKTQHMIRTSEGDFNPKIEVPFYRKVYGLIKEQINE